MSAAGVHGTAVVHRGTGLLVRGASGSGKSLLAARLVLAGAVLVGDDRLALERRGDAIFAAPVPPLEGLIELRGRGLLRLDHAAEARIDALVDIVPWRALERMPEEAALRGELLGVELARQPVPDRLDHALVLVEALCGGFAQRRGLRSPHV